MPTDNTKVILFIYLHSKNKYFEKLKIKINNSNINKNNKKTCNLLDKYDENIKILNLSNQNIEGILNLEKFKNLEELNCSNNKITEIINLPYIKYLNCSNNKISKILFLPNDERLIGINCKSNPLTHLYYPFIVKPNKYPSNLTHLEFYEQFNDNVDNLPKKLIHLTFGYKFNQPLNNLPDTLLYLCFINDNGKYASYSEFNQPLDNLPNSIIHLYLPDTYNIELCNLPNSLKIINFGGFYDKSINNLPDDIEELFFQYKILRTDDGKYYNHEYPDILKHEITKLPLKIKKITFGNDILINNDNLLDEINEKYLFEKNRKQKKYHSKIFCNL